jgi:drug/metabolite transporter (DMT)-like permease
LKISNRQWADLSLLLVTMMWGVTFIIVKQATQDLPPYPFLAMRFAIAFLCLLPFVIVQKSNISKATLFKGFVVGIFLFSGYAWQTIGLQYTSASNAGFITGLSVVFVPAIVALTTRKLPKRGLIVGIFSALIGLAFLSLGNQLKLNKGDLMVLVCAISFALQIFLVGRYAPHTNAIVLAATQILTVSLLSALFAVFTPQPPIHMNLTVWLALLITAIPATSLAFLLQTKMQQFTSPTHTALIFSMEPVFSAISAYLLAGEVLTWRGILGAGLMLGGMLLAEFTGSESEKPTK